MLSRYFLFLYFLSHFPPLIGFPLFGGFAMVERENIAIEMMNVPPVQKYWFTFG